MRPARFGCRVDDSDDLARHIAGSLGTIGSKDLNRIDRTRAPGDLVLVTCGITSNGAAWDEASSSPADDSGRRVQRVNTKLQLGSLVWLIYIPYTPFAYIGVVSGLNVGIC